MKNEFFISIAFLISELGFACELCKSKQPNGLENITHGKGPEGNLDFIIMYSAIIIVGFTFIMSVKYLIKPKERNKNHIKNLVLNDPKFHDLWITKER